MAKRKPAKPATKSEFLRKALSRNPNLDHRQLNQRWTKAGNPGTISPGLFYQVRAQLGIRTQWVWVRETERPPKGGSEAATGEVYQFKVTLKGSEPPIWRRIQVADGTLDSLHEQIQTAMGWTNSHLHHFKIGESLYGDPLLMGINFEDMSYRDSTTTFLSEILPRDTEDFTFEYEYDFGDGWIHDVLFEGRVPTVPRKQYPLCLEGARACPPEDCGGVWGYADLLDALADPAHEAHEDMKEWVGAKFDPEAFSAIVATKRMKQGLPDWRSIR